MLSTIFIAITALAAAGEDPLVQLGERIFHDNRFSSPAGDMTASCASCHMVNDPQGGRAFTEFLARSWHPWRNEDPGRDTLRNTPTLFDVAHMPLLHLDGEFASLEEQSLETLVGRNLGWLPYERQDATQHIAAVVTADGAYRAAIDAITGRPTDTLDHDSILNVLADALAALMRNMESLRDTPYDAFVALNGLDAGPSPDESPAAYADRILGELDRLEAFGALQRPRDFSEHALEGMRIFFRADATERAGNCVTCHTPPHFTDFQFHNTGVTQAEYDRAHGSGSFAALEIPTDDSLQRPSKIYMSIVERRDPQKVDLGRWNFATINSPSGKNSLDSAIAAFKTPTLRHLASTAPYMHNGAYLTIEDSIEQKMDAAFLYRLGQLRNGAPGIGRIHITEDDIPQLFAFLNTLNSPGARLAPPRRTVYTGAASSYYTRD